MIWFEAHRLLDPFDAFFRLANPGQHLALLHGNEVIVWIERQCPLLMVERLVVVVVHRQVHGGENAVHVAVVLVERQGLRHFRNQRAPRGLNVGAPASDGRLSEHAGLPGMRVRITGIKRDCARKHPPV